MSNKVELVKVQFWIGKELKKEIDDFAHGLSLASADFYKGGALLLKNMIMQPPDVNLNIFTRSFKDFENTQLQKKILKSYKESRNIYKK